MDYATFNGPLATTFDCACGAKCCRRVIRGTDYLLPEVINRYGDHCTAFVRSQRKPASSSSSTSSSNSK